MGRRSLVFASLAIAGLAHAGEGDPTSVNLWADALYWGRDEGHNKKLIIDEGEGHLNSCGSCSFSSCRAKELVKKFDFEPGGRVGLGVRVKETEVEASYAWLNEWTASCHRNDSGLLFFSTGTFFSDYTNADQASAEYQSRWQNGELNLYRYSVIPRTQPFGGGFIFGLRYAILREKIGLTYHKGSNRSTYDVETKNRLGGAQIGFSLAWNPTSWLSWDFFAKGGGFYDWIKGKDFLGNENNTVVIRSGEKSDHSVPIFVEGSLAFALRFSKWFDLRAGYQFFYLNGVALAPDQLSKKTTGSPSIRPNGAILLQGAFAGIAIRF
jgi:hypothetical protein